MGATEVGKTKLLIGMLFALVVSLSIHVMMLQVLGIPFPDFSGVSPWVAFVNTTLTVLSVVIFCQRARKRLARFSKPIRYFGVFLLYVMLRETFRGVLMSGFVTGDWRFNMIASLPSLLSGLVLIGMVMLIAPILRAFWIKVAASGAIAGSMMLAIKPLLGSVLASVIKAAAPVEHADLYAFPYGWQVLIPAYLSYAEPVIACTIIAALIWQSLSTNAPLRFLQFVLLVLLMRGMLLPTFLYSFYSKAPLASAMLSQSQFLFETIALAALTGLAWQWGGSQTEWRR